MQANMQARVPHATEKLNTLTEMHTALSSFQSGVCCNKIAEAEAVVSVSEKGLLVMHVQVQLA